MCTGGTRVWAVACQNTIYKYSIKPTLHVLYFHCMNPGKVLLVSCQDKIIYISSLKSALQLCILYIQECNVYQGDTGLGCGTSRYDVHIYIYIYTQSQIHICCMLHM